MRRNSLFSLLVAVFSVLFMSNSALAQHGGAEHVPTADETAHEPTKGKFNASHVIFGHIADAHEWHLLTMGETHVTMPLPVILYSAENGLAIFSSSKFGHEGADDYLTVTLKTYRSTLTTPHLAALRL